MRRNDCVKIFPLIEWRLADCDSTTTSFACQRNSSLFEQLTSKWWRKTLLNIKITALVQSLKESIGDMIGWFCRRTLRATWVTAVLAGTHPHHQHCRVRR